MRQFSHVKVVLFLIYASHIRAWRLFGAQGYFLLLFHHPASASAAVSSLVFRQFEFLDNTASPAPAVFSSMQACTDES